MRNLKLVAFVNGISQRAQLETGSDDVIDFENQHI